MSFLLRVESTEVSDFGTTVTQKTITKNFIVALFILAVLAATDYLLLASQIRIAESNALKIDRGGRQRMLSQRAAYLAAIIGSHAVEDRRNIAALDLAAVVDELEQIHELLAPSGADDARAAGVSEELYAIYYGSPVLLDQKTRRYAAAMRTLLAGSPGQLASESSLLQNLIESGAPLLAAQEAAVAQYQIERAKRLGVIRDLVTLTLFVFIACLFATGRFVFRPLVCQFDRDVDDKASRLSDAHFKSLSEASPIGIFFNDSVGNCTYTNPRWQEITGVDYENSLGDGWARMIHPDDKDRVFNEWERDINAHRGFSSEFRIQLLSGELRWVRSQAASIKSDSDPERITGYVGTTENITERKQIQDELQRSRERFDLAIRGTEDGIWDWDIRTNENYYSPRFEALLGYETSTVVQNYGSFESLLHPDDKMRVMESIRRHCEMHEPYQVEYRLKTKENSYRWFSAGGQAEWDDEGRATRMAGSIRDITERLEKEQELQNYTNEVVQARADVERQAKELQQRTDALTRSNKELEQFAYISSHDLQEPLRKIQAFGDRLNGKYGDVLGEQGQDYLDRMRASASRMQTLIQDLLAYSRLTREQPDFAPVALGSIVDDVVADLEMRIERENGRIEYSELPTIDGDTTQMRQLFQNLISNALKFHVDGRPPIVSISCQNSDTSAVHSASDNFYEIRVVDNGIGFDERYIDKIFAPFQRLHGRNEYEGTGIGLAVCQKIVERHGGKISVESTPGVGSTFIVSLPTEQSVSAFAA